MDAPQKQVKGLNVAVRGYQMIQSNGGTLHGVGIDKNLTQADASQSQVQWLMQ